MIVKGWARMNDEPLARTIEECGRVLIDWAEAERQGRRLAPRRGGRSYSCWTGLKAEAKGEANVATRGHRDCPGHYERRFDGKKSFQLCACVCHAGQEVKIEDYRIPVNPPLVLPLFTPGICECGCGESISAKAHIDSRFTRNHSIRLRTQLRAKGAKGDLDAILELAMRKWSTFHLPEKVVLDAEEIITNQAEAIDRLRLLVQARQ